MAAGYLRLPLIMPTPPARQIGAVDFLPNLLVTTLAVVAAAGLPPGKQLSGSAPFTARQVFCDQAVNCLPLPIVPPGALPIGRQLSDSAPRAAAPIQCEQQANRLALIGTQPQGRQLFQYAPRGPPSVQCEQQVNRLPLPIVPAGALPIGGRLLESAPRAALQVQCEPQTNRLPLVPVAAPALPPGQQLFDSAPRRTTLSPVQQFGQPLTLAGGNVSPALTGLKATFGEGSLALTHAQALAGQLISSAEGSVALGHAQALLGRSATFSEGSLATSRVLALTGGLATFSEGLVTVASPNVTLSLTGLRSVSGLGLLALSGDAVPVAAVTQDAGVAGKPKRLLYLIKVDGREVATHSLAEALEVLAEVKRLAKLHALQISREATERALQSPRPRALQAAIPKISGSRPLTTAVRETRKEIEDIYRAAFRDAEIGMLMELSRRADEDEDINLLLM